jgi:hypothetical protein
MTKQTKTIAMVLGLGAIGYWIYTRNKAKKSLNPFAKSSSFDGEDFFNASGMTSRRGGRVYGGDAPSPTCGDGCDNGSCYVPIYDANGTITYSRAKCGGGAGSGTILLSSKK